MTADEREFLAALHVGDIVSGTVTDDDAVLLDGFPARPLGWLGPLHLAWGPRLAHEVGQRITAEIIAVNVDRHLVRLSTAAIRFPELWAFLKGRRRGEILTGTVAAIKPFGVFVALDEGPAHPRFPGVGFVTHPDLSVPVEVGQRVAGEFLVFDTTNGEARMRMKTG